MKKLFMDPPTWSPEEIDLQNRIYGKERRHSPGMISFTYEPSASQDLEKLRETKTYKAIMRDRDRM